MASGGVEKHASGKFQSKAIDTLLLLVQAGSMPAVQGALVSGAAHKVPKVRAAAAKALTMAMRAFGAAGPRCDARSEGATIRQAIRHAIRQALRQALSHAYRVGA